MRVMAFRGDISTTAGRLGAWRDSLLVDHAVFRTVWTNFAEVMPGKLYRANHPTPGRLTAFARRHQLRTLINLRGPRFCGSDALSRERAEALGLDHVYMAFESRGAPHRDRILRFAELWRTIRFPALLHCKSGADRAGLAAGLAILFDGGASTTTKRSSSATSWPTASPASSPITCSGGNSQAAWVSRLTKAENLWRRNSYRALSSVVM